MQQRRFRPGDVLDDYCPRERRITDHAIVAMIDDHIKQTRCVVCDAEHEYKEGRVPPQRRKRPQAALFTQVLDGLQGPQPTARLANHDPGVEYEATVEEAAYAAGSHPAEPSGNGHGEVTLPAASITPERTGDADVAAPAANAQAAVVDAPDDRLPVPDEGPVRRSLIRATLPRPEGQSIPTRVMPEFTVRQPNNGRGGQRAGGRRRGGHHQQGQGGQGQTRFGRGGQGQGQKHHGAGRHGGSRRGGKKR
jgi:hypothetical protein